MIIIKITEENINTIKEKTEKVDRLTDIDMALSHVKSIISLCLYDHNKEKYLSESEALEILSTFHRQTILRMFEGLTKTIILINAGFSSQIPLLPVRNISLKFNVDQISDKILYLNKQEIDDSYFAFCIQKYIMAKSLYDEVAQEYLPDDELEHAIQEIIEKDIYKEYLQTLALQIEEETLLIPFRDFLDNLDI